MIFRNLFRRRRADKRSPRLMSVIIPGPGGQLLHITGPRLQGKELIAFMNSVKLCALNGGALLDDAYQLEIHPGMVCHPHRRPWVSAPVREVPNVN